MSTTTGQYSDRASIFVMGTVMGVAVAGAGALALSYSPALSASDSRRMHASGTRAGPDDTPPRASKIRPARPHSANEWDGTDAPPA